jgi:hypothetical protein
VPGKLLPEGLFDWALAWGLAAALAPAQGCVDPRTDYDDFIARVSAIPPPDAAPGASGDTGVASVPCSQVLASKPSGTFYGACLTTANAGDATAAIYVVVQNDVVPDADGTTGKVTITQTFLALHATNISQTVGPPQVYPTAPVTAACQYVVNAGTVNIPAAANSAGADLVLEDTRYRGKIENDDESCTALDAHVTAPVTVDLTQGGNYCVFRRAPASGAITPITLADFACPDAPSGT